VSYEHGLLYSFGIYEEYMQTNNILAPELFGVKKGISIQEAAFEMIDVVLKDINKKCILMKYSVFWQKCKSVSKITFGGGGVLKEQQQVGSDPIVSNRQKRID
jgi:hypothetical protein